MKCPSCQFENPDGVKFCGECGKKLEKICPECLSSNPIQFKFCGECGSKLSLPSQEPIQRALSFDEKLDKVQRYLPKGLTQDKKKRPLKILRKHRRCSKKWGVWLNSYPDFI